MHLVFAILAVAAGLWGSAFFFEPSALVRILNGGLIAVGGIVAFKHVLGQRISRAVHFAIAGLALGVFGLVLPASFVLWGIVLPFVGAIAYAFFLLPDLYPGLADTDTRLSAGLSIGFALLSALAVETLLVDGKLLPALFALLMCTGLAALAWPHKATPSTVPATH